MIELGYNKNEKRIKTTFPLINSVLNGLQDGSIFSDTGNDQSIFVLHKAGFSYLMSISEVDYLGFCKLMIGSKKIPEYFHMYDADYSLISFFEGEKDRVNIKVRKRVQLKFEKKTIEKDNFLLPSNYSIEMISLQNFAKLSVFNLKLETKFWRSEDDFLRNGFGYCVFNELNLPVSICYSACIANKIAEIDVATLTEYLNMGFAKAVVASFVQHCIKYDIIANWDCFQDNFSSLKTAWSIGFTHVTTYNLLSIFNKMKYNETA